MTRLTYTQRRRLQWLAANPKRYLVAYGHQTKTVHALLNAGLVERKPDDFGAFTITEAGKQASSETDLRSNR